LPICVSFHKIYEATGHFNETLYANGGHKLGQGGFGSVFYCKMDIRNGEQEFAVKLFSNKEAKPTEKRMQFETELNTITKLNHPHMLPLLGYGSHQNSLCLIYPYMALGSLDKYLSKSEFNSHQRITVIQDIASALHYLHNGCNDDVLVHRDVKRYTWQYLISLLSLI
jgi:serine/threonine protein kinase